MKLARVRRVGRGPGRRRCRSARHRRSGNPAGTSAGAARWNRASRCGDRPGRWQTAGCGRRPPRRRRKERPRRSRSVSGCMNGSPVRSSIVRSHSLPRHRHSNRPGVPPGPRRIPLPADLVASSRWPRSDSGCGVRIRAPPRTPPPRGRPLAPNRLVSSRRMWCRNMRSGPSGSKTGPRRCSHCRSRC